MKKLKHHHRQEGKILKKNFKRTFKKLKKNVQGFLDRAPDVGDQFVCDAYGQHAISFKPCISNSSSSGKKKHCRTSVNTLEDYNQDDFVLDSDADSIDEDDHDDVLNFDDPLEHHSSEESVEEDSQRRRKHLVLLPKRRPKFKMTRKKTYSPVNSDSDGRYDSDVQEDDDELQEASIGDPSVLYDDFSNSALNSRRPKVFSSYETGSAVIVLDHPSSFTFHGKAQIFALSGCIEIFGYTLSSSREKTSAYAYSSDRLFNLQVKTVTSDWKCATYWNSVKNVLAEHVPERLISPIMASCNDVSVIVMLKRPYLAYAVDFVSLHIPQTFPVCSKGLIKSQNKEFNISSNIFNAIHVTNFHQTLGDIINFAVRSCVDGSNGAPRILIYGKRGHGKSTSLRYFVNRVLSNYEKVYVLDCDPGQSEFTPPGCVSLTEVTSPLLGPPFTHPKKPLKTSFFGNIFLENAPAYISSVDKVIHHYKDNYWDQTLFINTMGWIQGLGKECLDCIQESISPNILIEVIEEQNVEPPFDPVKHSMDSVFHANSKWHFKLPRVNLFRPDENSLKLYNAEMKRDLSVLSYFGRCQPFYRPGQLLNSLKPHCVRVEDVAIHVIHSVYHKNLLQAICASFVALCHVDESQILVCIDDEQQCKRLIPDADFRDCLGFGIVRAIDISRNLIYILSPEPYEVLKNVNAIVKGNVPLPKVLFECQSIYDKPRPFVKQFSAERSELGHKVKKKMLPECH